jgi:hypothetical protein
MSFFSSLIHLPRIPVSRSDGLDCHDIDATPTIASGDFTDSIQTVDMILAIIYEFLISRLKVIIMNIHFSRTFVARFRTPQAIPPALHLGEFDRIRRRPNIAPQTGNRENTLNFP